MDIYYWWGIAYQSILLHLKVIRRRQGIAPMFEICYFLWCFPFIAVQGGLLPFMTLGVFTRVGIFVSFVLFFCWFLRIPLGDEPCLHLPHQVQLILLECVRAGVKTQMKLWIH